MGRAEASTIMALHIALSREIFRGRCQDLDTPKPKSVTDTDELPSHRPDPGRARRRTPEIETIREKENKQAPGSVGQCRVWRGVQGKVVNVQQVFVNVTS